MDIETLKLIGRLAAALEGINAEMKRINDEGVTVFGAVVPGEN